MARQRNDILSDLRLANFNKEPLKHRLALLLELNENDDDIVAHAGERLIEMHDAVQSIKEENIENHANIIKELVAEFKIYAAHPAIKQTLRPTLRPFRDTLEPLWGIIITKEEDNKLAELRHQFEQVSSVDWNSTDWLQKANQTISVYIKILKACERTWHAHSEQVGELKYEIENIVNNIRTEVMRRT